MGAMLIIDGHNLIPKIPGLSLEEMDDEEHLLRFLQLYARLKRKTVEVFFDGAPPGQAGERMAGTVRAYFVPIGQTADEAIRQRVAGLGRMARNATVVSSDRQVQANARALHAQVRTSEEFAAELLNLRQDQEARSAKARGKTKGTGLPSPDAGLPPQEIGEWLDLFGIDPVRAEQPIPMAKKPGVKRSSKSEPEEVIPPQVSLTAKKKNRPHHGFPKKG